MGLFRKSVNPAQLKSLEAELNAMRQRLDVADQEKTSLDTRLRTLNETSNRLDQQVELLTTTNSRLNERVELVAVLSAHVEELTNRLSPTSVPPPPTGRSPLPPTPPPPPDDGSDMADETLIGELREQLAQVAEQMLALDVRVTNVSTELANQLTELSQELDNFDDRDGANTNGTGDSGMEKRIETAVSSFRESTERLATEQARYEIQFRADLAKLADRLGKE